MTATDDLLKKMGALEAYLESLQKDVQHLYKYKEITIELRTEMKRIKEEGKEFWSMHKDYQEKKVRIKVLEDQCKTLGEKAKKNAENHDDLVNVTLVDYADMLGSYKQVKKIVIGVIISMLIAALTITLGLNLYFG